MKDIVLPNPDKVIPTTDPVPELNDDGTPKVVDNTDSPIPPIEGTPPVVTPTPDTPTIFVEGDIIEIDGKDFTIDTEGNAISTDGTKKTKEEIASLQTVSDDDSSTDFDWKDIQTELGYQPVNEKGEPIVYTNDKEGLKKYTLDTFNQYKSNVEKEVLNNFFDANKDIYQAYIHKVRTGTIEDFNAQPVWEDFDIDNANEIELETLYRAYRKSIGDDDESINDLVELAKKNKTLAAKASHAKEAFVTAQNAEKEEAKRIEKEAKDKEINDANLYWNKVKSVIDDGKIVIGDNEVVIPEVIKVNKNGVLKQYSRTDFYKYLTVPKSFEVNKQKVQATQYQYDKYLEDNARTHNHDVLDAFKVFVGGNLDQLIKRTIDTRQINDMKKRFTSKAKGGSTSGGSTIILPIKNNK